MNILVIDTLIKRNILIVQYSVCIHDKMWQLDLANMIMIILTKNSMYPKDVLQ